MLAKRIIACMDVADGRVVKGIHFKDLQYAGDPVLLGKKYSDEGADELVFLDIKATIENRKTLIELVKRVAKEINIPFTVGGGISSIKDIENLLKAGADKISIGSAAVKKPELINMASNKFGAQCIVISVDAKKYKNSWIVYIKGGREKAIRKNGSLIKAVEFAKEMEKRGAGELLVNSLDRDGTLNGYDNELLSKISKSVNIPVIASSGAGKKEHFLEAFRKGKVDAALSATLFHYKKISIEVIKKYLQKNKIIVRI